MNAKTAILILKAIKKQFQISIDEASYDKDALDALDDNMKVVRALDVGIKSIKRDNAIETKETIIKIGEYESISYQCSICNWHIEIQDRFCKNCGQNLKN